MVGTPKGEWCRTVAVCIDSYECSVPEGRLYHPYLGEGKEFYGVMQLLLELEQLLERMKFPKAFMAARAFERPCFSDTGPPGGNGGMGRVATFHVRVLFRQNVSWQGTARWLEGGREESFRSVLELLLLLDSAMQTSQQAIG